MTYTYEDRKSFAYIIRLIKHHPLPMKDFSDDLLFWAQRTGINKKKSTKSSKQNAEELYEKLQKWAIAPSSEPMTRMQKNLKGLAQLFALTSAEKEMMEGALLWKKNKYLRSFSGFCLHGNDLHLDSLAAFADMEEDNAQHLLISRAPLLRYGLLDLRRCFSNEYVVPVKMREFLMDKYNTLADMKQALLGKPFKSAWKARDFAYMPETDFAVKLIQNADQKKGFNILLYGKPGTGKTCFAQMLAAAGGRDLYSVGEEINEDRIRNYRLQKLHQKLNLLEKRKKSCLLFDEAEDLFSSRMTQCDKVEINRLLENNSCPVIWTTNDITHMDPAFIRRFTLAVHFEEPPIEIRQKIWRAQLKSYRVPCSSKGILALAKDFPVPPAMITGAAQAASMVKGGVDTVRQHLEIMTQAMRGGRKTRVEISQGNAFNVALINADTDLAALVQQIKKLGKLNFSLCLYGASGTGKSAYARFLADELNLEIQQERASDLISPYVGGTEENIASAFARAKEEKALLLFDEADSFLQDRSRARHSWEVTAVNEMLTWMENHPYPFVCTTNLMETLDPASLRRFSFKVKYSFLTVQQIVEGFSYFYKLKISPQQVYHLTSLTPGDFAVVKNKAELLGKLKDERALVKLLEEEQRVKQQRSIVKIGFLK